MYHQLLNLEIMYTMYSSTAELGNNARDVPSTAELGNNVQNVPSTAELGNNVHNVPSTAKIEVMYTMYHKLRNWKKCKVSCCH